MTQIVEKGDWIQFDPDSKKTETIRWQQKLSSRQEEYVALTYSVKDKQAGGSLFIQLGLADSFFKKCSKDESSNPIVPGGYKIQVDDAFQYGQNNEKTLRFLVFHNKDNKIYQHRFIETTAFSEIASKIEPYIPLPDITKALFGDYLRDF